MEMGTRIKNFLKDKRFIIVASVMAVVMLTWALWELLKHVPEILPEPPAPPAYVFNPDGTVTEAETGFLIDNRNEPITISRYNAGVTVDSETNRLASYSLPMAEVEFESGFAAGTMADSVKYGGKQALEKLYYSGDMKLDGIDYGGFSISYDYTDTGKLAAQFIGGNSYEAEYGNNAVAEQMSTAAIAYRTATLEAAGGVSALPTKIYKNAKLIREYTYNADDQIIFEADYINGVGFGYEYNGDALTVKKLYRIFNGISFNYETIDVHSDFQHSFVAEDYRYTYNGQDYITERINGGDRFFYSYLNDKMFLSESDNGDVEYILDGEFKYCGLVYDGLEYFYGYDMLGRIDSILDKNGEAAVQYYFTSTGEVYAISGDMAAGLGKANAILFDGRGFYDHDQKVYYVAGGVYDPATARFARVDSGSLTPVGNKVVPIDEYLTKNPVNKFTVIHDRIMQTVNEFFTRSEVETAYGLYTVNNDYDILGIADAYTLPYSITPFSFANMLNGNQVYTVAYDTPSHIAAAQTRIRVLTDPDCNAYVDFFEHYKPESGTMAIEGEFVFLGSLVCYRTIEDGIILYSVKENIPSNYIGKTNIYDYDNRKYIIFNKPDYDLEMFEGVRLIAGVTQEKYDQIQAQLSAVQAEAETTMHLTEEYMDPSNFSSNDREDFWSQVDVPEGKFLSFNEDGSYSVQDVPKPDNSQLWKTIAFVGAIVATVVLTTVITIATVGCGTPIVAAICVGALIGMATGLAVGVTVGASYEIINSLAHNEPINWQNVANTALEFGVTCAAVGAVTGAMVGGMAVGACFEKGTLVTTANGGVAIENISKGDKVLSRNDITGEVEEKTVVNTFVKETHKTTKIVVNNETIKTTPEHPFYVFGKGYVKAENLRSGDVVVTVNGKKFIVEKVQHAISEKGVTVYNFEVEDNHNYFVSSIGVLVHNTCLDGRMIKAVVGFMGIMGIISVDAAIIHLTNIGVITLPQIRSLTFEKVKEKEKEIVEEIKRRLGLDQILIFRRGNKTYTNLTPRPEKDITGLSFTLDPPWGTNFVVSSLALVNGTGILKAEIDGPTHVSVFPDAGDIEIWAATREMATTSPHPYTLLLFSIVFEVRL
jgi:hypothetical protein